MKISLNWLKDYIDIPSTPQELEEILTALGLEVEGMEEVESVPGGLRGLVVGEVLTCDQHPNADRLSLTTVDVGGESPLQIVCGAPNVATGQKVVVATIGTQLHPIEGDPFKIKKGKIRGEVSEGMICAEDEIGIGASHDGIIVLPAEIPVGHPAAEVYNIVNDIVYEIGLTPNRSDATSHIGVAKDLLAYYRYHNDATLQLRYPIADLDVQPDTSKAVQVNVMDEVGCPRFSGVTLSNAKITPSPEWMQTRLKAIGVRPISNIVDITNYVLHEYGQPLHAYDLAKVTDQKIYVEHLSEGSKFTSLDEKERILSAEDLMVCDGQHQPMCIAGVFGGLESGVKDETTDIFLEGAHWDAQMIRKTSTKHNLRTDAAKVFEKGSDPSHTVDAIRRAATLMVEFGGATVTTDFVDIYPKVVEKAQIQVRKQAIVDLIGCTILPEQIQRIFDALEIHVDSEDEDSYIVSIPTDKADVLREADVIEEILRIYGFNNVPIPERLSTSIMYADRQDKVAVRQRIAEVLTNQGYNEMMGLSLIPSATYKDLAEYKDQLVLINNTSNIHLDAMRPEMMMSALISARHNINRQQRDLTLFENGRSYQKDEEGYTESEWMVILASGTVAAHDWTVASRPIAFVDVKRAVQAIFDRLGLQGYQVSELEDPRFAYGLKYHRGPMVIAKLGTVSKLSKQIADIDQDVMYAEILMDGVQKAAQKATVKTVEIPKFPSSRRDLALAMNEDISYEQVAKVINKSGGSHLKEVSLFDVYRDKKHLGADKKSYAVSLTFEDAEMTLNDKVIDKMMNKVINNLQSELGVSLR